MEKIETEDMSENDKMEADEMFENEEEKSSTTDLAKFKRPLDDSFLSSDEAASFGRNRLVICIS